MSTLLYYLRYLLLLYLVFLLFITDTQITYAQPHYMSNFDYHSRPSRFISNNIKKLRPFISSTDTIDQRIKQSSSMMNITRLQRSRNPWEQLKFEQKYPLRSRLFVSYAKNRMNFAIPQAISPFLQSFNDNKKEEKPISVKPKLPTTTTTATTTTATTAMTTTPSTSHALPITTVDEIKQSKTQVKWRKLGPVVKSIQYPFKRRNWQRLILARNHNGSSHFSNRMQKIMKNFLLQKHLKRNNNAKVEKRSRIGGTLLSNNHLKSKLFTNKVDEWPKETVEPTRSTASISEVADITMPDTDFVTEVASKSTTADISSITSTPVVVIPTTTTTTTTVSSSTSSFNSKFNDFDSQTTSEPKSFHLNTETNDYHFRRITTPKKFKFAQKYRRQPRLKIRKQSDKELLRGNQTVFGRNLITLPQLEPLSLENDNEQINLHDDLNDKSIEFTANNNKGETNDDEESGYGKFRNDDFDLTGFGDSRPPPVDFTGKDDISIFGSNNHKQSQVDDRRKKLETTEKTTEKSTASTETTITTTTSSKFSSENLEQSRLEAVPILQNSGLVSVAPPSDFIGDFGTGKVRPMFSNLFHGPQLESGNFDNDIKESIFTGDSALTPNRIGPTGDGLGPPIPSGAAIPPPVPAVGIGGAAAGILPSSPNRHIRTENSATTIKPSALLNFLTKADIGFNQAINHFEKGTPIESAAIDILEVALGSEKLDSQAKLLGHIDRTIGLDNIQRIQRWANTAGAMDIIKEQLVKFIKNYTIPVHLIPTVPPQFEYLFAPGGKR